METSWNVLIKYHSISLSLFSNIPSFVFVCSNNGPVCLLACNEMPNSGNVGKCTRYNKMEMPDLWIATKCYKVSWNFVALFNKYN